MTRHRWTLTLTALMLATAPGIAGTATSDTTPRRVLGKGLRLGCENTRAHVTLNVKPRRCLLWDATQSSAGSVNLAKLRWTRWSSSGATATGVDCGFHETCENTKVRVTLSGLKLERCWRNNYRAFTRAKVTSRFGTTRIGPPVCPFGEG